MKDVLFPNSALNVVPKRGRKKKSEKESPDDSLATNNTSLPAYERFISGPIPLDWLLKAQAQGSAAFYVGVFLWYFSGMNGRKRVFRVGVNNLMLDAVSRKTVQRGLKRLGTAGLISQHPKDGSKGNIEIIELSSELQISK